MEKFVVEEDRIKKAKKIEAVIEDYKKNKSKKKENFGYRNWQWRNSRIFL